MNSEIRHVCLHTEGEQNNVKKLNSVPLVAEKTTPTESSSPVGDVSGNFCG
jgi:hypothetical protein